MVFTFSLTALLFIVLVAFFLGLITPLLVLVYFTWTADIQ